MRFSRGLWLGVGIVVALAACSGGGSSGPSGPTCTTPAAQIPQLLYPVPGATGVPDSVGILIYQGYASSPNVVTLTNGSRTVATSPTALPAMLPSPIASPSRANGTTYAVSLPTLSSASLAIALFALPAGCNPSTEQFGYFQTL